MAHMPQTIAKNTVILMGSQLTTWTLTLLLTIFLPRYLGAAGVGKLYFATALWMVVGIVIALGTGTLLTKEIARAPQRTAELFSTVVILRLFVFFLGFGITVGLLRLLNYPADTIVVACIIGLANLVDQVATACQAALQGLERMSGFSLGNIVGKTIDTSVGILLLLSGWGIYTIAALLILSTTIRCCIQFFYLKRLHELRFVFRPALALRLVRAGLPYLLSGIFLVCYLQMNVMVISFLISEQAVGWYSAADRLFNTLLFIPTVFMMAVFPVFSRMKMTDTTTLYKLMAKSFDGLLLLGVPIGLGLTVVAGPIVALLFGPEFANSGPILAILGISLIFMYENVLLGQFLISVDKQNYWTVVMAVATVLLVLLDVLLIPLAQEWWGNGPIGGALAYVITELGMVIAGICLLPKGILGWRNFWFAFRVAVAGLAMVAVAWWLNAQLLLIPITAGAAVYLSLVLVMGVISKSDLRLLRESTQQLLTRPQRPSTAPIRG